MSEHTIYLGDLNSGHQALFSLASICNSYNYKVTEIYEAEKDYEDTVSIVGINLEKRNCENELKDYVNVYLEDSHKLYARGKTLDFLANTLYVNFQKLVELDVIDMKGCE